MTLSGEETPESIVDFNLPTGLVDYLAELVHRKVLKNERFLALIAELFNELDEGFVLFVESGSRAKKKNALK